jgi:hypothetical protein
LNWEGQCLREDGELPDTLPALTLEEAVALIAASGAEARFKGGAVISDYRDELDDLSYMEVESAHEDGYERGVATALSWTRDVLARVS